MQEGGAVLRRLTSRTHIHAHAPHTQQILPIISTTRTHYRHYYRASRTHMHAHTHTRTHTVWGFTGWYRGSGGGSPPTQAREATSIQGSGSGIYVCWIQEFVSEFQPLRNPQSAFAVKWSIWKAGAAEIAQSPEMFEKCTSPHASPHTHTHLHSTTH
jgi:hypothetical protein